MSRNARRFLPVLLWIGVIYTTIPFVRFLRDRFAAHWDLRLISWLVAAVLIIGTGAALAILGRRPGRLSATAIVAIVASTLALVSVTFTLRRSPEESVHLIEYGTLALLVYRALRPSISDASVFVAGALIGSLVGTVDEVIQWLVPSRTFDWRDVGLNAAAGALVQLALWRASVPSRQLISVPSLRFVLRLAAALLVLMTLCLANTPERVARYAPLLPDAGHLTSSLNPMAEYGHLHTIPGLGRFKSRMGLAEIGLEDGSRAAEVAVVLDATRHRYGEFLDTWPVGDDPFTYEARVHLFARDRNLGKARSRGLSEATVREHLTIAWFENRLLEELFPTTLEHSAYPWREPTRRRVEAGADLEAEFRSAVASNLITFASESRIRIILLSLVAICIVADVVAGHSRQVIS